MPLSTTGDALTAIVRPSFIDQFGTPVVALALATPSVRLNAAIAVPRRLGSIAERFSQLAFDAMEFFLLKSCNQQVSFSLIFRVSELLDRP